MEGKNGQTEKATAKRRGDEREKGNLALSQEVISVAVLLSGVIAIRYSFPAYVMGIRQLLRSSLDVMQTGMEWNGNWLQGHYWVVLQSVTRVIAPFLLIISIAGIVSSIAQTGPYFSWKAFQAGGLKALSPIKGAKQLFSTKSIATLFMTLGKIFLIGGIAFLFWRNKWWAVLQMNAFGLESTIRWMGLNLYYSVMFIVMLAVAIAAIDVILVWRRHERSMMMTKHEVKDEYKQYQVKPEVKKAQARKMRSLTLSRLVAEVPKADVIVTNPTHVSIAIQYDPDTMSAPKVVAKGLRKRALRIREIAREHGIPIVERPPLARAIYRNVPTGRLIPSSLFAGVAEVLAYLYRLGYRLKGVRIPENHGNREDAIASTAGGQP